MPLGMLFCLYKSICTKQKMENSRNENRPISLKTTAAEK